jgi:hypothetical protein
MDLSAVNWVAILVAAVSAFILGGIWYGPLFGKTWQRLSELSDEDVQQGHPAKIFGGALVLTLVMAASLGLLLQLHPAPNLGSGLAAGALLGLTLIAASQGINFLFARKPLQLWFIESGYMVVLMAMMGAILGAWR